LQLIPRDAQFYDMFAEVAKRLTGSATLLHEAFKDLSGLEADVVDLIDGAARRVVIFHVKESRPHAVRLSEILFRSACCIEETVKQMKDPKAVSAGNRQLKLLEEEGDAVYHEGMDVLFMNATDAILVVKWKELYDKIEDAIDQCEDVGNVLQSISLKNA
jgi:hypothetical protein